MERIDPSQHFYHLPSGLRQEGRKTQKNQSTEKTKFSRTLKTQELKEQSALAGLDLDGDFIDEESLAGLLDEIQQWGESLAANPSPGNIQEYRRRVGTFMRSVVRNALTVEENEGRLRKDMKKPKYTLIRVVNQKLDQLAVAILSNQKDRFDILARTNELKGLLVDMIS